VHRIVSKQTGKTIKQLGQCRILINSKSSTLIILRQLPSNGCKQQQMESLRTVTGEDKENAGLFYTNITRYYIYYGQIILIWL